MMPITLIFTRDFRHHNLKIFGRIIQIFRPTDDELNLDSSSISQCINHAISKINPKEEKHNSDSQVAFPLEKTYETCQVIVELIQKLPDIPWFPNGK